MTDYFSLVYLDSCQCFGNRRMRGSQQNLAHRTVARSDLMPKAAGVLRTRAAVVSAACALHGGIFAGFSPAEQGRGKEGSQIAGMSRTFFCNSTPRNRA